MLPQLTNVFWLFSCSNLLYGGVFRMLIEVKLRKSQIQCKDPIWKLQAWRDFHILTKSREFIISKPIRIFHMSCVYDDQFWLSVFPANALDVILTSFLLHSFIEPENRQRITWSSTPFGTKGRSLRDFTVESFAVSAFRPTACIPFVFTFNGSTNFI